MRRLGSSPKASKAHCHLNVCDALSVDAERLRRRLSELLSEHSGTLLRLRLKAGGRMQRVTINRTRGKVFS